MNTPKAAQAKSPETTAAPSPVEVAPSALEKSLAEPLFNACIETNHKAVVALLAQGASPNLSHMLLRGGEQHGVAPLQAMLMAVSNADATPRMLRKQVVRIAKTLFEAGAQIGNLERNLLLNTVALDADELLDVLVARGARVQRRHGFELMSLAMANESTLMINALVRQSVNPNMRDAHFSTPFLDWCSGFLRSRRTVSTPAPRDPQILSKIIQQFMESGVDINLPDHLGATPLMRALVAGENEVAKALILAKANTELLLRNGVGALHLAAACGSQDFLRFLSTQEIPTSDLKRLRIKNMQPDVKSIVLSLQASA